MRAATKPLRRLLLIGCALCMLPTAAAEVYRWTDGNGLVHYGQRPPSGGAERIELPRDAAGAATPDGAAAARRDRQQRVLDAYEYERGRKRAAEARAQHQREQLAAHCSELQQRWKLLSHPGPVYHRRADGGRDYLDDGQRAAQLDRLRPAYLEACGRAP